MQNSKWYFIRPIDQIGVSSENSISTLRDVLQS